MKNHRATMLALLLTLLLGGTHAASAGVSVNLHIGYLPALVPVPGYPVYYAPQLSANFFFYDGSYWLFEEGRWYASDWYDGPWEYVDPYYVPAFVLRVPVRYYRVPPPWFRGGYYMAPPRWGHYWGPGWSQHRHGWEYWDRHHSPRPAPLPYYQRDYRGDRYPGSHRQQELHRQHYRYNAGSDWRREQPPRRESRPERHQQFQRDSDHRQQPGRDGGNNGRYQNRDQRDGSREQAGWRNPYLQQDRRQQEGPRSQRERTQEPQRGWNQEPQRGWHQEPQRAWKQERQREPRTDQSRQTRQEQFRHEQRPRPEHQMKPQQWQARQAEGARRESHQQQWQQGRGGDQMRGRDAGHRQNEGHRDRAGRSDGRGHN